MLRNLQSESSRTHLALDGSAGRFARAAKFICGHHTPTQLDARLSENQKRPCRSSPKHGTGTNDRKTRTAQSRALEIDAAEIRIRAERRLGEMLREQKETVGLNTGAMGVGTSAVPKENRTPTLADAGIDKKLSSRAQKVAAVPAGEFEGMMARHPHAGKRTRHGRHPALRRNRNGSP